MKATLIQRSAIQKAIITTAFLPLAFVVYPLAAHAATAAQNNGDSALVLENNSKQKDNETSELVVRPVTEEINPTLINPCYPAPVVSCSAGMNSEQQSAEQAQALDVVTDSKDKTYSKEEVQQLIIRYSAEYGINAETPLCIARLESGYNQFSKNRRSTASGVFQYLTSTWRNTDEGKAGLDIFDADANVKAAVKYMSARKSTQPWMVRSKCPRVTVVR